MPILSARAILLVQRLIILLAIAIAVPSLVTRWGWEKDNTRVEICLDGRELLAAAQNESSVAADALQRLRMSGVTSVALYWAPPEQPEASLLPLLPADMSVVMRPEPAPFAALPDFGKTLEKSPVTMRTASLLFAGNAVWGFPDMRPAKEWIQSTSWRLPWVEFSRQFGAEALVRAFPDRIVRAHSLDEEEMAKSRPADVRTRFSRAVRERGIRFVYLRFFPGLSLEANLDWVNSVGESLRRNGFRLEPAMPGPYSSSGRAFLSAGLSQILALLAAIFLPWLAFRKALQRPHPVFSPILLTVLSVGSALIVAGFISSPNFLLGLDRFRGVKLALALPLVFVFLTVFSRDELRRLGRTPLTVGLAVALLMMAAVGAFYLMRSGHESFLSAGGSERRLREILESLLGVRPRFKEFMIGHPLLWVGFYLLHKSGTSKKLPETFWGTRILLVAGFVGQLSIVNTFCHAHTPLSISLLRTFHGFWVGALLGAGLILGINFLQRTRVSRLLIPDDSERGG